jgi:RHS repeat-associated protein
MRYAALILTLLVIGLLGGISWQIVQFRAEPSIHVDGGDIFDVGIVPADRPVSHVFKLENPNPFPLSVSAPVAGCTCTTATVSSATILPGGEVSVTTHIYAVSDLSGNIRNWWSSSTRGNLDPYAYEAYGVEWITPAPEPPITYNVPFFYEGDVGYYQDPTTGLYYIKARWYDPVTGRFIGVDPIWPRGGVNPYDYVANNPIGDMDPTGLAGLDTLALFLGGCALSAGFSLVGDLWRGETSCEVFCDAISSCVVAGGTAAIIDLVPELVEVLGPCAFSSAGGFLGSQLDGLCKQRLCNCAQKKMTRDQLTCFIATTVITALVSCLTGQTISNAYERRLVGFVIGQLSSALGRLCKEPSL